jgi:hypothetical protein
MNPRSQDPSALDPISGGAPQIVADSAEATLRLIANLPAPDGLPDRAIARVIAALETAPPTARVLRWPAVWQPAGSFMRGAAAAAIVFVVAGGGWGIYTRIQPSQPARVIVMPPRIPAPGGFSSAGAMRTPQTLNGPVLSLPVAAPSVTVQPVRVRPLKKLPEPIAPAAAAPAPQPIPQPVADNQASAPPAEPAAK